MRMRNEFRANNVEKAVINYLIESVLAGETFHKIDKSFLDNVAVRGNPSLWCGIMGSIRGQLAVNPNDKEGFSITPKWAREVYSDYWKTNNPVVWHPGELNLESLNSDATAPNRKEVIPKKWYAYSTKEDMPEVIRLFPIKDEGLNYYRGFLRAVKAKKWYRVTLEELEIDTEQDR